MIRPRMTVAIYTGALIVALSACGTTGSIGTTPAPTGAIPSAPAPTQPTTPNTTPPAPGPAATEINPPGDIPDNQAFVTYKGATGRYVVKVPEGWSRTAAGQSASFTDKLNSISVAQITQAAAPTVASVTATEVPALQARVPQLSSAKVTTFTRPGGSGVMVTYLADSAPNPVTNREMMRLFREHCGAPFGLWRR